ncbi:hypothetical protein CISG_01450 [Coccidioides immitis RMSCC 3703]|uniref:Uncharacterized protein n=1 Tax=Coccidioides immitis RMSCC 3703 TaxID=454286 RepID=A0A0J8R201_COCIT|nr:hypothetical protein CISG_01450 [Coccidioides immitis RMSCC 3703]
MSLLASGRSFTITYEAHRGWDKAKGPAGQMVGQILIELHRFNNNNDDEFGALLLNPIDLLHSVLRVRNAATQAHPPFYIPVKTSVETPRSPGSKQEEHRARRIRPQHRQAFSPAKQLNSPQRK